MPLTSVFTRAGVGSMLRTANYFPLSPLCPLCLLIDHIYAECSRWIVGLQEVASQTPEGYSQKNWVGMCSQFPKAPTLFRTKICVIGLPTLWPDQKFKTIFMT